MQIIGSLALLLAFVGCAGIMPPAQRADEAQEYEFQVGTQWTYTLRSGEKILATQTVRVTKMEKGVTYLSGESRRVTGKTVSYNELRWVRNGGLWISSDLEARANILEGPDRDLAIEKSLASGEMLYKLGSNKGDRWVSFLGDTTGEHQGKVEVQVPAGTYKDAIHIKVLSDDDGRIVSEHWLVPRVGLVRITLPPLVLELEKFEEP